MPEIPGFTAHAVQQQNQNWCWAAVCSACSYLEGSNPRPTRQIVADIAGPSLPDAPYPLDGALGLTGFGINPIQRSAAYAGQIRAAIDRGNPVAINVVWSSGGTAHAICAYGYGAQAGGATFRVFDPLEPDPTDGDQFRTVRETEIDSYFEGPVQNTMGRWGTAFEVLIA